MRLFFCFAPDFFRSGEGRVGKALAKYEKFRRMKTLDEAPQMGTKLNLQDETGGACQKGLSTKMLRLLQLLLDTDL